MKNEILEEVWIHRDALAKKYHYDLDEIIASLQEMEKHPLSTVVDRSVETQISLESKKILRAKVHL
jgi:hypothetical protein